jgi:tRNA U34 5-carboxymethylaminomethyl modifying GTPase MnmE/TrmE
LKQLRVRTSQTAKEYAKQCKTAATTADAKELMETAVKALEDLYLTEVRNISRIINVVIYFLFVFSSPFLV